VNKDTNQLGLSNIKALRDQCDDSIALAARSGISKIEHLALLSSRVGENYEILGVPVGVKLKLRPSVLFALVEHRWAKDLSLDDAISEFLNTKLSPAMEGFGAKAL
jgi:hypothetical protein